MTILLIGTAEKLAALEDLRSAYRLRGFQCPAIIYKEQPPAKKRLRQLAIDHHADALLLLYPARMAPTQVIDGPVIRLSEDRVIPVGILPAAANDRLRLFAATAAKIQNRPGHTTGIAVLAQDKPRFLKVAQRMVHSLEKTNENRQVFQWSCERMIPEDLRAGLASGLGCALYFGHGRSMGWAGYAGFRIQHFLAKKPPMGALLSLCCDTAKRKQGAYSFSERLVLDGICGASFGAVRPTLHTDNTRWAVRLSHPLSSGIQRIGAVIQAALPKNESAVQPYRLFGDPLSLLASHPQHLTNAQNIPTYP